MLKEFKEFIMRGNVLDLAVAVVMGGAFGAVVNSLVNDIIMPVVGRLTGGVDFSNLFIDLSGAPLLRSQMPRKQARPRSITDYSSTPLLHF